MNREVVSVSSSISSSSPVKDLSHLERSMVRLLPSNGKEEIIGKGVLIKRVEFVRVVTDALYALGYETSESALEKESGVELHSSEVSELKALLLGGDWDESLIDLQIVGVMDDTSLNCVSFSILEHKFLELLVKGRDLDALKTLRTELFPLQINIKRVQELCTFFLLSSSLILDKLGVQDVDSAWPKLLEKLEAVLPPTILIPHRQLEQLDHCSDDVSRYSDYQPDHLESPNSCSQVLHAHNDEVFFVQFSNNGKYLASSSKDNTAIIWEVYPDKNVYLKHRLAGHEKPVIMVAWSPGDVMLLTCGLEEVVRCWKVDSGTCLHVYGGTGLEAISCCWFPDEDFLATGFSNGNIYSWTVNGKEIIRLEGQRKVMISDLAVTLKSWILVSKCKENKILLYDYVQDFKKSFEVDVPITSFSLSREGSGLLLNLIDHRMQFWDITKKPKLIASYNGVVRKRFVTRSCLGGKNEAYIACGFENSKIGIWKLDEVDPVTFLDGHSDSVNCVSWNPTNPHMLASGSDDHTVRIWVYTPEML